jgi:hypothetical protein
MRDGGTYIPPTRILASFHQSRLWQLQMCLAEAQRHILDSREMIMDTQRSILTLNGMLRDLSMARLKRDNWLSTHASSPKVFDGNQN